MPNINNGITAGQVKLLMQSGERLNVEFKERYTLRIDEDFIAFANAKGGTLLLGVRDDGTIVGAHINYQGNYPENYPENHCLDPAESRNNPSRIGKRAPNQRWRYKISSKKMQDKGFLRLIGPDKGGYWEVIGQKE